MPLGAPEYPLAPAIGEGYSYPHVPAVLARRLRRPQISTGGVATAGVPGVC
jgi:hypothetical protein